MKSRTLINKLRLYIALDRPTFDLKKIKHPTERAKKSAQELETILLKSWIKPARVISKLLMTQATCYLSF